MSELSSEDHTFKLSRIYAQGWNAAKASLASGNGDIDAGQVAMRNPYRDSEERSRWLKGFMEALESPPIRSPRQANSSRAAAVKATSRRSVGAHWRR